MVYYDKLVLEVLCRDINIISFFYYIIKSILRILHSFFHILKDYSLYIILIFYAIILMNLSIYF